MLQYFHNGADTVQDQMTLVASGGMKTSMPATLIIRILPVNDEMPILVNNTGLEVWAGATSPITNRHLGKINYLFLGSAPHWKSYNLQYNTLGCWTDRLMVQVLFLKIENKRVCRALKIPYFHFCKVMKNKKIN